MSEKTGTFLVTHAEAETATLRDVVDSQVITLSENPGVEAGEVIEATVAAEPPMEVTSAVTDLTDRRTIPVERVDLEPTAMAKDVAADQSVGEVTTRERAGEGEVHVLTVAADQTETAAAEIVDDEATVSRAARLGVDRVEIRTETGVVSVRYLPD